MAVYTYGGETKEIPEGEEGTKSTINVGGKKVTIYHGGKEAYEKAQEDTTRDRDTGGGGGGGTSGGTSEPEVVEMVSEQGKVSYFSEEDVGARKERGWSETGKTFESPEKLQEKRYTTTEGGVAKERESFEEAKQERAKEALDKPFVKEEGESWSDFKSDVKQMRAKQITEQIKKIKEAPEGSKFRVPVTQTGTPYGSAYAVGFGVRGKKEAINQLREYGANLKKGDIQRIERIQQEQEVVRERAEARREAKQFTKGQEIEEAIQRRKTEWGRTAEAVEQVAKGKAKTITLGSPEISKEAEYVWQQAGPYEKLGLISRTGFSEKGPELVASAFIPGTESGIETTKEKLTEDIRAMEAGRTPLEAAGVGAVEGLASLPGTAGLAVAGGSVTTIGLSKLGSTGTLAAQTALMGAGLVGASLTGIEATKDIQEGEVSEGAGELIRLGTALGGFYAGAKATQTRITGQRVADYMTRGKKTEAGYEYAQTAKYKPPTLREPKGTLQIQRKYKIPSGISEKMALKGELPPLQEEIPLSDVFTTRSARFEAAISRLGGKMSKKGAVLVPRTKPKFNIPQGGVPASTIKPTTPSTITGGIFTLGAVEEEEITEVTPTQEVEVSPLPEVETKLKPEFKPITETRPFTEPIELPKSRVQPETAETAFTPLKLQTIPETITETITPEPLITIPTGGVGLPPFPGWGDLGLGERGVGETKRKGPEQEFKPSLAGLLYGEETEEPEGVTGFGIRLPEKTEKKKKGPFGLL